jgi:(p)ppGpp synthase/HD superfamily hydrolase
MPLRLITRAAAFAGQAHATHRRKANQEPYVNHLLRVAHEAARAGLSSEVIVAAYLHDTVEDTDVTLEELAQRFPPRVVRLVELLTKWWPEDASDDEKRRGKEKYYAEILRDQEAIELKLCDRGDNLRDMATVANSHRPWAIAFLKKTESEVTQILAKSQNPHVQQFYQQSIDSLRRACQST